MKNQMIVEVTPGSYKDLQMNAVAPNTWISSLEAMMNVPGYYEVPGRGKNETVNLDIPLGYSPIFGIVFALNDPVTKTPFLELDAYSSDIGDDITKLKEIGEDLSASIQENNQTIAQVTANLGAKSYSMTEAQTQDAATRISQAKAVKMLYDATSCLVTHDVNGASQLGTIEAIIGYSILCAPRNIGIGSYDIELSKVVTALSNAVRAGYLKMTVKFDTTAMEAGKTLETTVAAIRDAGYSLIEDPLPEGEYLKSLASQLALSKAPRGRILGTPSSWFSAENSVQYSPDGTALVTLKTAEELKTISAFAGRYSSSSLPPSDTGSSVGFTIPPPVPQGSVGYFSTGVDHTVRGAGSFSP